MQVTRYRASVLLSGVLLSGVLVSLVACGAQGPEAPTQAGNAVAQGGSSAGEAASLPPGLATTAGQGGQAGSADPGLNGEPVAGAGGAGGSSGQGQGGSGGGAAGAAQGGAGADGMNTPEVICPDAKLPAPVIGEVTPACEDFVFNYTYNEGPTWVAAEQAFFFTNFTERSPDGGDIIKYIPGGSCEVFLADVGCNGLAVSPRGTLLGACHGPRAILEIDVATKEATVLADMYMGQMLDAPNDLVAHSNGSIYFGNTTYELGTRPPGFGMGLFWIDPAGTLSLVQAGGAPNGVALSPDESRLHVVRGGQWDIAEDGTPLNGQDPVLTVGDGMAVDCAGNLYVARTIRSPDGQQIGTLPAGSNMAFGGEDRTTLLVVGRENSVSTIKMNLPGFP